MRGRALVGWFDGRPRLEEPLAWPHASAGRALASVAAIRAN